MNPDVHRYQRWPGRLENPAPLSSLLAIVITGVRLQYNRRYVKPLLLAGPICVAGICLMLYLLAMLETLAGQPSARGLYDFARTFIGVDLSAVSQIGELREVIWRSVFAFAIHVQLFAVMILVARIGPGLIADDIKTRALSIYFAHPVTPKSYMIGKWLVAAAFVASVTMIPNLVALVIGSMITPGLSGIGPAVSLGLDLVIAGLGIMLMSGLVMLALSSMTSDSRYVTVGWLAVCMIPAVAQVIVRENIPRERVTGWLASISIKDNVNVLVERLFNLRAGWEASSLPPEAFAKALGHPIELFYPAMVLSGATLVAGAICFRRIRTFSQAAASA